MEINKEKEQKALTGFILSIISICLWLVILIIWLYTNVFQFVDHKILNLFMSILWSLGCATGIVFGIIVLAKLKYSDGITKNPYKTFRIISKILSIVIK